MRNFQDTFKAHYQCFKMQNSNCNICSQAYLVQRRVHAEKYGLKSLKQFTQKIFNILFTNVK